jgi:Flp pilus assembly protein TadD
MANTTFSSTIPTAQALVSAVARALRLTGHPVFRSKVSHTTRKTFARDGRVKPETREEYVRGLAHAINSQHVMFPCATAAELPTPSDRDADLIARGIGEFAIAWDTCVRDTLAYGSGATSTPIGILPFVRLGLEDLGLRLAGHALDRPSWLLRAPADDVAAGLSVGSAFMPALRHLLREFGLKRVHLLDEIPLDTLEGWEQEAVLPTAENLGRLAKFFTAREGVPLGIQLDLRIAVALSELWRWLRAQQVPDVACRRMAEGFVDWTRAMATWIARERMTSDEIGWTVLRGARNPTIAVKWISLAITMPNRRLADDLRVLPGDWTSRCRSENGVLGDMSLGATDARDSLRHDSGDRVLEDDDLLAVLRCIPPVSRWNDCKRGIVTLPTSAELEGTGAKLLHEHRWTEAIRYLTHAAALEPCSAWPRIALAQALEGAGALDDAETAITAAMRLDPTVVDAHLVHASILLAENRPHDALATLEGIAERSAQPAVVMQYMTQAYIALARWTDAERTARCGLEHNREHTVLWTALAVCLDHQGRLREARAAAKEAAHRGDTFMVDALACRGRS